MNNKHSNVFYAGDQFLKNFHDIMLKHYSSIGLKFDENIINLKVFEFNERSITTKGFVLSDNFTPKIVTFKSKKKSIKFKVLDSIITSEVAVLYLDKDPRKYSYCKKFFLTQEYIGNDGIFNQITTIKV